MRFLLFFPILALFVALSLAQDTKETRTKTVTKLKSFTDEQLRESLDKAMESAGFRNDDDSLYEPYLREIVRRGGKTWEAFLKAKLELLNKKQGEDSEPGSRRNLELLTALRRVQKKPDPVTVVLDMQGPLEATSLSLPILKVAIKNVDCDKTAVGFRNSGDYRNGRQERWRIVIRDDKGRELPVLEDMPVPHQHGNLIVEIKGGQYQEDVLDYGESWKTELNANSFVRIRQPGKYSLEVLYHDTKTIADESDISGLIFSHSKSFPLVIRPPVIVLTAQERKQAVQWIADLDANRRLKVIVGTYGKWAYNFVPPTAPEGRLLATGIKAVPVLVQSLEDKSLSDKKRAWILALLFSATGENDPCDSSALGDYDYQEAGWQVLGNRSGEGASGGMAMPKEGSSSNGRIDHEYQDRLIAKWEDWIKRVEVRQGN